MSLDRSYQYCEQLARREAGSFFPAFRVLPREQRLATCALYAFMRHSDDITDAVDGVADRHESLQDWRRRFDDMLRGVYSHPLHLAFHDTLERHSIPRTYIDEVLKGVEMDLAKSRYETFAELRQYCYRVASAVGLACIHIWGCREARALSLAENVGIAFQLTNILRDLREDAERDRVYLPQEDLRRFDYAEAQLRACQRNSNFDALMRFEVGRARDYYQAAPDLYQLLPPAGRAVFRVMWGTYEGILNQIEKRNYDVFTSRIRLSRWAKWSLVLQAVPSRLGWA